MDIQKLSSNLCEVKGTYLSWNEIQFNLLGNVKIRKFAVSEVCGSEKLTVLLPTDTNIFSAIESCNLLPDGVISEFSSVNELTKLKLLGNREKYKRGKYLHFWTPYSGKLKP